MFEIDIKNTEFSPKDPNSFSRSDLVAVKSLHLSLDINFKRCVLAGKVSLKAEKIKNNINELVLDVKDLNIYSVINFANGEKLKYEISNNVKGIGSKLTVFLPVDINKIFTVVIHYETSPQADALHWLSPVQTSGKNYPFMFSLGQPIAIRSIIPCQDTPSVKTSFVAEITAPSELTVLMGAHFYNKPIKLLNGTTFHQFYQNVPIPSYLIAIAVGALESRQVGLRTHVWAEKELLEQAEYEFQDTERMLKIAEKICGPYIWGKYDILVLPPSFAFGGMENPCLTFTTPTILAGDRSLVNVIAHEIAHSWTGNLVTAANFEHFWLNEGFTTFIERKMIGELIDEEERDLATVMGIDELKDNIQKLGDKHPYTKLVIDLKGIHPNDVFSKVPNEKGQLFVRYLEQTVGSEPFGKFLKHFLEKFKYQSIETNDFKKVFIEYFSGNKKLIKINWQSWLYSPGMPTILPLLNISKMHKSIVLKQKWLHWTNAIKKPSFDNMSIRQICYFLNILYKENILYEEQDKLKAIKEVYNFNEVKNVEIKFCWLRVCLKARWHEQILYALNFVNEVGRAKFVFQIYKELYDWEETRLKAIQNFKLNKDILMQVTQKGVEKILNL